MPKFIAFPVCSRAFADVRQASERGQPYLFFDGYTLRDIDLMSFVFIYKHGYLNASQMQNAQSILYANSGTLPTPVTRLWDHILRVAVEVSAPISPTIRLQNLPTRIVQYGYSLGSEQWNMLYFPSSVIAPATRAIVGLEHAVSLAIGRIKGRLLAEAPNSKWWLSEQVADLLIASSLAKTINALVQRSQVLNEIRTANLGTLLGIHVNGRSATAAPTQLASSINYKMIADTNAIIAPAWHSIMQLFALSQQELRQSQVTTFVNLLNTIKPTLNAISGNKFSDKQLLSIVKGNLIGEAL